MSTSKKFEVNMENRSILREVTPQILDQEWEQIG